MLALASPALSPHTRTLSPFRTRKKSALMRKTRGSGVRYTPPNSRRSTHTINMAAINPDKMPTAKALRDLDVLGADNKRVTVGDKIGMTGVSVVILLRHLG